MYDVIAFKAAMNAAIEQSGTNIAEIARVLGVPDPTLRTTLIRRPEQRMDVILAAQVADYLGVSLLGLLRGKVIFRAEAEALFSQLASLPEPARRGFSAALRAEFGSTNSLPAPDTPDTEGKAQR